ncbi:PAS domain-containing hybrid sensor histidine kinase/response regulator [Solidesulfovibrio sp.]
MDQTAVSAFCLQLGPDGRVRRLDRAALSLFGDIVGAPCPAPCPPVGRCRDWSGFGRVWRLAATTPFPARTAPAAPDCAAPAAGAAAGLALWGTDITDLVAADALARSRKRQLDAILEGAREGVVIAAAGRLVYVNPFMERLTGHDAATLCSRPFVEFLHPEDRDMVLSVHLSRLADQPAPASYVFRIVTATGGVRYVNASSSCIDWDGQPAAMSFLADITAQKAAEASLTEMVRDQEAIIASRTASLREINLRLSAEIAERRESNERLSAEIQGHERTAAKLKAARLKTAKALRAKSVFLANMSHEIRTPLNVVLGMADMALRPDSQGQVDQVRALEMIREAGSSLRGILGDLLDLSRAESGRLELEREVFSPALVVKGVLNAHGDLARRQEIALSGTVAGDVPDRLLGDARRLGQVLGNLVGNALKFTLAGQVTVAVALAGDGRPADDGSLTLRFAVRDTGIGIPADKHRTIFASFSQADETISRRFGGTGLGLAICRRLVGLMGGRIRVKSAPGEGSEFTFTARFGPAPAEAGPAAVMAPAREVAPLEILLAEDSDLSAEMIQAFLAPKGHTVVRVVNGEEALRTLALRRFDVVLMDIQMPVLDGIAATRAIRSGTLAGVPRAIPIVALTAYGAERDRERILESGVTDYLAKPVSFDRLLEVLARVMEPGGNGPAQPRAPACREDCPPPPVFDAGRAEALENLGGDGELYDRLVAVFLRDTPDDCRRLAEAQAAGDLAGVSLVAHSVKGNAGIVGATQAAGRAMELEHAARTGRSQGLETLVAALLESLERTSAGFLAQGHVPAVA